MSSTNKTTGRSGSRSVAEDMMWQGVRPKAPNLLNQLAQREQLERANRPMFDQSRQTGKITSFKGEQTLTNTGEKLHEDSIVSQPQASLSDVQNRDEVNFPVRPAMFKTNSQ